MTFANSLCPDQAQPNVNSDLDFYCLSLSYSFRFISCRQHFAGGGGCVVSTANLLNDILMDLIPNNNYETLDQLGKMQNDLSRDMRFPTMWYVRPAKAQTSLRIRAV